MLPENVERESEIVAQAGRAGAVTIATNMAGRGTDIILGGNSDYMARLKLREVLLSRLVRPEEDHKPAIPAAQRSRWICRWCGVHPSRSSESLYPCTTKDTDQALGHGTQCEGWGDRALSLIELEERIATAAEKAPTEDLRSRPCATRSAV